MIFRLLLLFLIIWFLFWIIKKQFLGSSSSTDQQIPDNSEDIIPCSLCGTHVPSSLGIKKEGKFYCSQEHADMEKSDLDEK
jgi:hypothetical protein